MIHNPMTKYPFCTVETKNQKIIPSLRMLSKTSKKSQYPVSNVLTFLIEEFHNGVHPVLIKRLAPLLEPLDVEALVHLLELLPVDSSKVTQI